MDKRYWFARIIFIVFCLGLLTGCQKSPSSPTRNPVPLATWIAQGVPDDTEIKYKTDNPFMGFEESVIIKADGTIKSSITSFDKSARGTGQISQEELKRILIEFVEIDFFSLAVEGGCVYNVRRPPAEGSNKIIATDSPWVSISF